MFGDRKRLMLPILFDIANLVKTASITSPDHRRLQKYPEIERIPSAQFLKRSYIPLEPIDEETTTQPEVSEAILMTEPPEFNSNLQDDRLHVDDDKSTTTNIFSLPEPENILKEKSPRSLSEKLPNIDPVDDRSYHERKLNMTNFNGTHDQFAMESEGVPPQVVAPKSLFVVNPNMTLEEYEELAFKELNETDSVTYVRNETTGELLPMPEMLISRYRTKNPYRKLLAGTNSVEGMRNCERFGNLCLRVEDYPMQAIMGSIRRHKHAMSALLAEYIDKEDAAAIRPYIEEFKRREDDELTPTGMCPSVIRYARPQKARSATGEWKYIVNTGQHTQTLRLEKCSNPDESCTYLTDNFRSRCSQIFNYHRLLSWDNTRGLHIDIFKVPTCCSCHIDGYKEKFPPINSYNSGHDDYRFSASNIHSHHTPYSTILNNDNDDDDAESSIAYQYSNGFKRSPTKLNKFGDTSILLSSITKPRFDKGKHSKSPLYSLNPSLESYLTPPTSNDFETAYSHSSPSFGGLSNRKRRRPVRTNSRDQSVAGSEILPDITVFPGHDINTERSYSTSGIKRKYTTPISVTIPITTNKRVSATSTGQLPSISTASTSAIDLGKRVNYNYHPIIDFFGDSLKSEKEIADRVGYSEARTWRPPNNNNMMRRRQ